MKITKDHLRAIIMEEMESILQERESDAPFVDLVDLFILAWLNPDNLVQKKNSLALDYKKKKILDKMPSFMRRLLGTGKSLELRPDVVTQMVERAGNIAGIEKVFSDPKSLVSLFQTKVNLIYDRSPQLKNSIGWFDPKNGEVSINFASPPIQSVSNYSKTGLDLTPSSKIALEILKNSNALFLTFQHEMTHMINYHRALGRSINQAGVPTKAIRKALAAAGGKGNLTPGLKQAVKYANSTEEMQARLVHIFKDLEGSIASGARGKTFNISTAAPKQMAAGATVEVQTEIQALVNLFEEIINSGMPINNNIKVNLISLVIGIYDLYYPHYVSIKTDKVRKRMAGRIFDFVERMISKYGGEA